MNEEMLRLQNFWINSAYNAECIICEENITDNFDTVYDMVTAVLAHQCPPGYVQAHEN